jgi:hypothetical protein
MKKIYGNKVSSRTFFFLSVFVGVLIGAPPGIRGKMFLSGFFGPPRRGFYGTAGMAGIFGALSDK